MTHCYLLGFLLLSYELQQFHICHQPDFVFRVGKKEMEDRKALLQFLVLVMACVNCKCAWLLALAALLILNLV